MTNISEEHPVLSGRYELHRRIARGGMAEVFLARDQLLDRPVAVKVLFPQYAADPTFVARFRREAQAAANLNHPNIVAVYDWGHQDDTYFIVMEYVEGQSLAEMLSNKERLAPSDAARMVSDVAGALGFAHRNGTVHRDVKPGNIMITNDNQVKVADFGIARAFGQADDQLTQTGSVMGTASYFSPEQAQGKQVDPRSDLYSLGVVLFEMVTGQTPFAGESPVAIAYKHVQETPPRPSHLNSDVTPELEAIIARLLAKNPEQRFSSADDFRNDIDRYMNGQAPQAVSALNGGDATMAMSVDNGGQDRTLGARAVIDTTRAVPASVASGQAEPVEEYFVQTNRTGVFLVALLGLLVVLVVLLLWIFTVVRSGSESPGLVTVPNVVGLTADEAEAELTELGLMVERSFEECDEPVDVVCAQAPGRNTEVEPESAVSITISQGEEVVQIPNVVGLDEEQATTQLDEAGFEVDVVTESSDEVPDGQVISINPGVGETANAGSIVTLTVSSGGTTIQIPDVQGTTQDVAQERLNNAGFTNIQVSEEASDLPPNTAIRTNPAAGSSARPSAAITIIISSGESEVDVPNVVGKSQEEAEEDLQAAGLTPVVDDQGGDDKTVSQQSPAAGSKVAPDADVTITVGDNVSATTTVPQTTTTTEATTTTVASVE